MNVYFGIILFLASIVLTCTGYVENGEVESGYFPGFSNEDNVPTGPTGHGNTFVKDYDPKVPPSSPVNVKVTMYILDISKVDDFENEFSIQFYFRQKWVDPRLKLRSDSQFLMDIGEIWKPDTFFVEEKEGKLHTVMFPNVFLRLHPKNTILFSTRLSMTFRCNVNLRYFPFDYQKCKFSIESYGYNANAIKYFWDDNHGKSTVGFSEDIDLPDFEFLNLEYSSEEVTMSTGNYSRLNVELSFRRKLGFYMYTIYVPFIVLVLISFTSFWIWPRMTYLRLTLILTTLFIMFMLTLSIADASPSVSYMKAIDVWVGICLCFVFGSLLQSVFVAQAAKSERKKEKKAKESVLISVDYEKLKNDSHGESFDSQRALAASEIVAANLSNDRRWSERAEVVSRILFPAFFGVFNLIYWLTFATGE